MKKEWQLSQATFDRLLHWLDPEPTQAGAKYERIRHKLVKIFVYRGSNIPEDLADETINRVAERLPDFEAEYVGDPMRYFYRVAQNVFLESTRRRALTLTEMPQPASSAELEKMYRCLEACVDRLPQDQQQLILEYYQCDQRSKIDHRKAMARRRGFTLNVLRLRTHRIRVELQKCLRECLKRIAG